MRTRLALLPFTLTLLIAGAAGAAETQLSDPAMTPSSEHIIGTFGAVLAQDENTSTDWASNDDGLNTYADFNFGQPTRITRFEFTDRVTSGGPQGAQQGGNEDDISGFDLIFSIDSTFGNGDDVVVPLTSGLIFPGYATESYVINGGDGYNVQYVRWDVTAKTGSSMALGAAEFDFFTDTADLSITKEAPSSVVVRQNFSYLITVTNNGPAGAAFPVVSDTIPPGTTFVSAEASQGSCIEGPPVECSLGEILSGDSATIEIVVTAPNTPEELTNTATVENDGEVDPTPGNDASSPATTFVTFAPAEIPTASSWALFALMGALLALAVVKLR